MNHQLSMMLEKIEILEARMSIVENQNKLAVLTTSKSVKQEQSPMTPVPATETPKTKKKFDVKYNCGVCKKGMVTAPKLACDCKIHRKCLVTVDAITKTKQTLKECPVCMTDLPTALIESIDKNRSNMMKAQEKKRIKKNEEKAIATPLPKDDSDEESKAVSPDEVDTESFDSNDAEIESIMNEINADIDVERELYSLKL